MVTQVIPSDDQSTPSLSGNQAAVNAAAESNIQITPRPNPLDQYPSYAYSASVYLLSQDQYGQLLNSASKRIDGYQLLFQSGGAAVGDRSQFFGNDFYIDSITVENLPPGKGTGAAHNLCNLKFTVIEPNGITLLDRLYDAVASIAPTGGDGKVNYTAVTYLMVLRFYGYDQSGNPVQIRNKQDQEGTSASDALIEKFIPFRVKSINWSVESKLVSYEWDCVPVHQMIAGYAARGTIPYDVQLVDSTVGGLLGGDAAYSSSSAAANNPGASTTADTRNQSAAETARLNRQAGNTKAPPKADAAPTDKKTITNGLVGAMNDFQKKLVNDGIYEIADVYEIRFEGEDAERIKNAKLQLPNTKVDKRLTAAGQAPTQDAQNLDPAKQSVDMISRSFSITAGQQLLQAIELAIRNSSYIYDQALVIFNPDGTVQPNPDAANKPFRWFSIMMSAEPIGDTIDTKRNDYAYKIIYTVRSYTPKNAISKYFPISAFSGVHKTYPYWFSGRNIAVLDYKETLNSLYQLTISGSDTDKSAAAQTRERFTSSMSDIITYNYAPTSTESSQGALGRENEAAANMAEVLYSPGDLRECKIQIIGDPDWIMQGSVFRIPTDEVIPGEAVSTGFLPDGSIAFDTQDILFEITWQRPRDYNIGNGLANPNDTLGERYNSYTKAQSRVYLCKKVVSEFKQGKFVQTLEGVLYLFPIPNKTNAANPAAANTLNDSAAINERSATRLARQGGVGASPADNSFNNAEMAKFLRQGTGGLSGSSALGAQPTVLAVPSVQVKNTGVATVLGTATRTSDSQLQTASVPGMPTSGGTSVSSLPPTLQASVGRLPPAISGRIRANAQILSGNTGTSVSSSNPSNQLMARDE